MQKKNILIVEDDRGIRNALQEILELENYDVITAKNGEEGLKLLKGDNIPHLVLLDLTMPVMNGAEFLKELKKDKSFTGLPVILLTAASDIKIPTVEVTDVLKKPFEIEALLKKIVQYT